VGTIAEIGRQLNPRRTMEVLLAKAESVGPAADVITRHVGPAGEVKPAAAESTVRFRTADDDEGLAKLLGELAGLGVAQFREVQTDLEEAFMTVARADQP